MKTTTQLTTEFYNALTSDVDLQNLINDRLYWISRVTIDNTFPLVTYQYIDAVGAYIMNDAVFASHDEVTVQFNVYVDPQDVSTMFEICDKIVSVMEGLKWRKLTTPPTFLEDNINKNVRPIRFEVLNV